MPSCSPAIERTKPLLGTFVSIRVHGLEPTAAHHAIADCFAEVATIHQLMSFQDSRSDVTRMNREAHLRPVRVDPRTYDVLRHSAHISQLSEGVFDITVAPRVVSAHAMSAPQGTSMPDPAARWSDVILLEDCCVRFMRPLWIDLSGIAKGFATDRASELISGWSQAQSCVNAGGDLRIAGSESEWVRLDSHGAAESMVPTVQLKNASIASSGARLDSRSCDRECRVEHIDGAARHRSPRRFVSVLAPTCLFADALTKVVMARGEGSSAVLRECGARAVMSEGMDEWVQFP
jgi:FAD:protein FMN transferase